MNAGRAASGLRRWPEGLRWGICFALALCFHAAGAAALLARWTDDSAIVGGAPVIMIDLAPDVGTPDTTPTDLPPGPLQTESEPEPQPQTPIEKIELQPKPKAEVVLPAEKPKLVEKPREKKSKQKHASLDSAPIATDRKSDRAAAGSAAYRPNAAADWKSRLVAQLERNKRYPQEAQLRGDRGTVHVTFSVDRSGGVHRVRVVRGSGSSLLDRDALAWVERSQPLPPPPPELPGAQIPVDVPLRYNMR